MKKALSFVVAAAMAMSVATPVLADELQSQSSTPRQ